MGASVLAMDATVAPVSIAVELDTLVTSIFRYCSGARRWGLDWMSDFFCMGHMIATLYDRSTVLMMAVNVVNIGGEHMTRLIQEAYIVAATRTPVCKAPRGMF